MADESAVLIPETPAGIATESAITRLVAAVVAAEMRGQPDEFEHWLERKLNDYASVKLLSKAERESLRLEMFAGRYATVDPNDICEIGHAIMARNEGSETIKNLIKGAARQISNPNFGPQKPVHQYAHEVRHLLERAGAKVPKGV